MKVTAWTNEEYARKHYIDPSDERLNLLNPNKKALSLNELKKLAETKNIPYKEFVENWLKEYKNLPTFTDEEKAKEYIDILLEIEKCVIKHCKEKGIRFSADYHQYGDYGVPIIDDKYMYYTFARTWGRIMAEADNDFSDKGYLQYYLYANENPNIYPNEVEEERII